MRHPLDLPEVHPRPPLPKKQYTTLYNQFNAALPGGPKPQQPSTEPSAPTKRAAGRPRKNAAPAPASTRKGRSILAVPTGAASTATSSSSGSLPAIVIKAIRSICANPSLAAPPATTPHMLAGARVVLSSQPASTKNITPGQPLPKHLRATLAGLYIALTSKLSGTGISGRDYTRMRTIMTHVMSSPTLGTDEDDADGEYEEDDEFPQEINESIQLTNTDVDQALQGIMANTMALAWLSKVGTAQAEIFEDEEEREEEEVEEKWVDEDDLKPKKRRREREQAGLGRMMQDRTDWLSQKRRGQYGQWKADIMRRCAEIESRGG